MTAVYNGRRTVIPAPPPSGGSDYQMLMNVLADSKPGHVVQLQTNDNGDPYLTDGTILADNRIIEGTHERLAVIKQMDGANLNAVIATSTWLGSPVSASQPLTVRHLGIDGNKTNQTAGDGHGVVGQSFFSNYEHLIISNTRADGLRLTCQAQDGTEFTSGHTAVETNVYRVQVRSADGVGIHVHDPTPTTTLAITDGWIDKCIVSDAALDSIKLDTAAGWNVVHNHVYGPVKRSGIRAGRCFNTSIVDNYIETWGADTATAGTYCAIDCYNDFQADNGAPNVIANNRGRFSASGINSSSLLFAIGIQASNGATAYFAVTGNAFKGVTNTNGSVGLRAKCQGSTAVIDMTESGNLMRGWDTNLQYQPNGGTLYLNGIAQ